MKTSGQHRIERRHAAIVAGSLLALGGLPRCPRAPITGDLAKAAGCLASVGAMMTLPPIKGCSSSTPALATATTQVEFW